MKIKLFSLPLLLIAATSAIASEEMEMLYTAEGYPYSNIVAKADQVTLRYLGPSSEQHMKCRVQVVFADRTWESAELSVSNEGFQNDPFRACLGRDEAKAILEGMYK